MAEAQRGRRHSPETRAKIAAAQMGARNHAYGKRGRLHPLYGKRLSAAHREKISLAVRAAMLRPDVKKGGWANRGRRATPETRAKMSASRRGKKKSLAWRQKMSLRVRGANNPMYGREVSAETRRKIAIAHAGRIFSDETRRKISVALTEHAVGEATRRKLSARAVSKETRRKMSAAHADFTGPRNPNWRGGVTTENVCLRGSRKMKVWRKAVFERDNYTCQTCGTRGGRLNADHIKPFATHPDLRFDVSNGRTLCEPCHRKTPTYGHRKKHAYPVSSQGCSYSPEYSESYVGGSVSAAMPRSERNALNG